jgi:hypothetical protein
MERSGGSFIAKSGSSLVRKTGSTIDGPAPQEGDENAAEEEEGELEHPDVIAFQFGMFQDPAFMIKDLPNLEDEDNDTRDELLIKKVGRRKGF